MNKSTHKTSHKNGEEPASSADETAAAERAESLEAEELTRELKSGAPENSDQAMGDAEEDDSAIKIADLEKINSKLNDDHLRLAAEFDNYRKRARTELETRLKFSTQGFALSIIDCIDDLELALHHVLSADSEKSAGMQEITKGISLTLDKFKAAFTENSISVIDAAGQEFDPKLHEAVGMIENSELQNNQIHDVLKKGYLLHDRVIRPAVVQVVKNNK